MLKVVHINTYDGNGGAGRACLRLNKALLAENINSKVIVHYKFGKNEQVGTFNKNAVQKAYTAAAIIVERILAKRFLKPLKRTPFSFIWFGRSVINHPDVKAADVIHLHWINHSFLNPAHLAELAKLKKPIVWTFHDSNAFTGGCHVRYTCDHFLRQCGHCPLLKNEADDLSHKIWEQKHEAYSQLNFNVIAPSSWMLGSVLKSSLMHDRPALQIPNTLETEMFKPVDKAQAKKALSLPEDKFIFLTGFMPSRKDMHKGTSYLMDSLDDLKERLGLQAEQVELVVFGNRGTKDVPDFGFKTTFLGTISDDNKLAQCYAAADAFLIPSLEDNLPYTVMESLACGTPVVAFTTGGIPDMVQHEYNGYLAEYRSARSFTDGMEWIINYPDRIALQQQARQTVMTKFAEPVIAQKHLQLYNQLLGKPQIGEVNV